VILITFIMCVNSFINGMWGGVGWVKKLRTLRKMMKSFVYYILKSVKHTLSHVIVYLMSASTV
jgi:hypothetical protein